MNTLEWQQEWGTEMETGMVEIDEQHRHFIFLVRHLIDSIVERLEVDEIRRRAQMIRDDGVRHFEFEERMLVSRNYPDVAHHIREHQAILRRIGQAMENFEIDTTGEQKTEAALDINRVLIQHLLYQDRKYSEYFRSQSA